MKITFLTFILFVTSFNCEAQESKEVLFIGNSYTYFWNLPQCVEELSVDQPIHLNTRQSTAGGANLGQHWNSEKNLETIEILNENKFDAVILQDHSLRAIEHPDSLLYYGIKLGNLIKSRGARPFVYMTWSRKWNPYMQKTITAKYIELAEKINAQIVPVGLAWQRSIELRPDLELYDEDGSHPSALGTYLTACVFYGTLTGSSPIGLPKRIVTEDADGEKLYLNIQSQETATFCQMVADEVIRNFVD